MKKSRRFLPLAGKFFAAALAFALFTQCSEEPKESASAQPVVETVSNEGDEPVLSLTIDGVHTSIVSLADCKKCDYVVPENATVVDGKEIGIKPGQAICLDENFNYGNLKLINLEGDEKNPIIVAYNMKDPSAIAEK